MSSYVSKRLRSLIASRAKGKCEYCLTPALFCIDPFVAEHIHPVSKGGVTSTENLAFSCMGCNGYKQDKTEAYDPFSQSIVALYHPRVHLWKDHFVWNIEFTHLIPLSGIGRISIIELQLNRAGVVNLRNILLITGQHPALS